MDKAVAGIIDAYKTWMYRRPFERDRAWYCPICTAVGYGDPQKVPECPRHFGMRRYSEEEFSRRRRELAEAAIRDIPGVVPVFAKAIEMYGGQPAAWRFVNGVVVVEASGVELRYEDGVMHAVFYRCDLDSCCEAAKFLRDEAVRLGLKIVEEFYSQHFCPPAYYDKHKGAYVYKA